MLVACIIRNNYDYGTRVHGCSELQRAASFSIKRNDVLLLLRGVYSRLSRLSAKFTSLIKHKKKC